MRYGPEEAGSQIVGPETSERLRPSSRSQNKPSRAIAAEPGSESAWIGARLARRLRAATSGRAAEQPSALCLRAGRARSHRRRRSHPKTNRVCPTEPGVGAKGAAFVITCPQPARLLAGDDARLAVSSLHPAGTGTEAGGSREDTDPAFETLITERPPDQGLPGHAPDTLPPDDSGLLGELTSAPSVPREQTTKQEESRASRCRCSRTSTASVHGSTLELRFHLAVKARLKLIAKRDKRVVASTADHTFTAGNRSLQLHLNRSAGRPNLQLQSARARTAANGVAESEQRDDRHDLARVPRPARHARCRDCCREPPMRGLRAGRARVGCDTLAGQRERARARLVGVRRFGARARRARFGQSSAEEVYSANRRRCSRARSR